MSSEAVPGRALPDGVQRDLCSIKDIIRAINDLERDLKRAYGLGVHEAVCLCCVSSEFRTPGDCAAQMGLSPPQISRIIGSLESKGLVERYAVPRDLRVTGLKITAAGRKQLAEIRRSGFTFSRLDEILEQSEGPK